MGTIDDILKAMDRIPVWKRMQQALVEIDALRARVEVLEAKLAPAIGEQCPRCKAMAFMLVDSAPDEIFGALGGRNDHYHCTACGLEQTKLRS